MTDEQQLIERARTGDERAFAALLVPYYRTRFDAEHGRAGIAYRSGSLYGWASRQCAKRGSKNPEEDALNVCQETVFRAWQRIAAFRGDSTFKTWLHGIAKHVIAHTFRHQMSPWRNDPPVDNDETAHVVATFTDYARLPLGARYVLAPHNGLHRSPCRIKQQQVSEDAERVDLELSLDADAGFDESQDSEGDADPILDSVTTDDSTWPQADDDLRRAAREFVASLPEGYREVLRLVLDLATLQDIAAATGRPVGRAGVSFDMHSARYLRTRVLAMIDEGREHYSLSEWVPVVQQALDETAPAALNTAPQAPANTDQRNRQPEPENV